MFVVYETLKRNIAPFFFHADEKSNRTSLLVPVEKVRKRNPLIQSVLPLSLLFLSISAKD